MEKQKIKAEEILLENKNFYNLCIGRISSIILENQNSNFLINKIIKFGKKKIKSNLKIQM